MRRPFRWDKKYLYWGITAFCVVAAAILFYMALNYIGIVGNAIKALVNILSPFIWGLVISYLLGPLVRTLENKLFRPLASKLYKNNKRSDGHGFARGLSILFSEIIMLAIIVALIYLIIPQLYSSIETIVVNSPTYIDNGTQWLTKLLENYPEIEQYAVQALGDVNEFLANWLKNSVLPGLGNLITNVGAGVYYVVMAVYNLVIGIIVSVYMLGSKETFKANAKRVMYTLFSVETVKKIFDGLDFTDKTFMGFIRGQLLDAMIVGFVCYIGCVLLRIPYALLIGVIVAMTNVIPFFGPFIGGVPSALLVLMVDPLKCVMFVIFINVLQQIDGNIICPKVLGSSIGINGFWVMFSIILGAGLFGFWGMLLGVPVFVVIYTLINKLIGRKLKRNDLPYETEDYIDVDYIDPATLQPVKHEEEVPGEKA